MNNLTLKVYVWLRTLMVCEEAQDMVEYALLLALVACGATAGMKLLAVGVDQAFDSLALSVRHYASTRVDD
ncbi:MAG: Flp family type IVb pilin [Acidobacteriota bacterium]|nr:Flp family type IVb pilin [Acidobacteriota bacterium]